MAVLGIPSQESAGGFQRVTCPKRELVRRTAVPYDATVRVVDVSEDVGEG